jgi:ABC-type bacteriocin/lantibiotic exporter with double-glycine peptidase domain
MKFIFETIRLLYNILDKKEQKRAVYLLLMMIVMAFIDALGVASIMPFMAVASNTDIIKKNEILANIYNYFNFSNENEFLFALGIFVFVIFVLSLSFKALTNYFQLRFAYDQEYLLSSKLLKHFLHQNYIWFLDKNGSELSKTILSEVSLVIYQSLLPLMNFIAQSLVSCSLLILLFIINFNITMIVSLIIIGIYLIIFKISKDYLNKIGKLRFKYNEERYRATFEAFGAIKEIKLRGFEFIYILHFNNVARFYAKYQSSAQIIAQLPRFILEMVAFGSLILILIFSIKNESSLNGIIPILSVFAFAGYKLMPSMQQVYAAASQIQFGLEGLKKINNELHNFQKTKKINKNKKITPIMFNEYILLENIYYRYPESQNYVIKNININIPKKSMVAIVGPSGSGKSTVLDILLGLLLPEKGKLKIDKVHINENNLKSWQNIIGYVPQDIYLSDETIAQNIAFGIDNNNIDMNKIRQVAKIANIDDFIINELPEGYNTKVGDRGVRLSGGQRQRIGIARALYHGPEVLIMDEATSALDNISEKKIIESIERLSNSITIVLVAHRLSTVQNCDKIYLMSNGEVVNCGTYNELLDKSELFRKMAKKNGDYNNA